MQRIFLDTSVQAERILGELDRRVSIARRLTQPDIEAFTCGYVWMEYQRSLTADFVHVHRQFLTAQSLEEAMTWVASGARRFRLRSLIRSIRVAALALGDAEQASLTEARDRLELYLTTFLPTTFQHRVAFLPDDPIVCDLLAVGPTRQPDGTYAIPASCRKETASCHLPDFLAGKRPELRTVADYLAAHPGVIKDQGRVCQLLQTVLDDPRAALGQAACWPLGDVIIALHVPAGTALWTLDPDFEPLAAALGLALHEPAAAH